MDPIHSIDAPSAGADSTEDEDLMRPFDQDDERRSPQGPGEGDAQVMAWARAM
jgi:hypothetical protein